MAMALEHRVAVIWPAYRGSRSIKDWQEYTA